MGEAKKEITEKKQLMLHKEKADSVAALDDDQLNEKIQNFIAHVKAAGFSNALALKALKHVCPDDPTEGRIPNIFCRFLSFNQFIKYIKIINNTENPISHRIGMISGNVYCHVG